MSSLLYVGNLYIDEIVNASIQYGISCVGFDVDRFSDYLVNWSTSKGSVIHPDGHVLSLSDVGAIYLEQPLEQYLGTYRPLTMESDEFYIRNELEAQIRGLIYSASGKVLNPPPDGGIWAPLIWRMELGAKGVKFPAIVNSWNSREVHQRYPGWKPVNRLADERFVSLQQVRTDNRIRILKVGDTILPSGTGHTSNDVILHLMDLVSEVTSSKIIEIEVDEQGTCTYLSIYPRLDGYGPAAARAIVKLVASDRTERASV